MTKHPSALSFIRGAGASIKRRVVDVEWGRPVFKAPDILNPRIVFDPMPFRTQSFAASRSVQAR